MGFLKRWNQIRNERLSREERQRADKLKELGITRQTEANHVRIATVLSFFLPGSGQIYRGYIALGFIYLLLTGFMYLYVFPLGILFHILAVCNASQILVDKNVEDALSAA